MKKIKFVLGMAFLAAAAIVSTPVHAQKSSSNAAFEEGTLTVNIGIGLGRGSYGGYGYYGSGYYGYGTAFGVKAAIERGMWTLGPGVLSLGLEAGGSFSTASFNSGYKSSIIIAAVRSAYHYGFNVEKLDAYGGVSLGPGFRSYNYDNQAPGKNTRHDIVVSPGIFVGASYFFSPNIGVNVEAGYDITQLQGGVIFKF